MSTSPLQLAELLAMYRVAVIAHNSINSLIDNMEKAGDVPGWLYGAQNSAKVWRDITKRDYIAHLEESFK
jgi:hypothetical protein